MAIRQVGYVDAAEPFHADRVRIVAAKCIHAALAHVLMLRGNLERSLTTAALRGASRSSGKRFVEAQDVQRDLPSRGGGGDVKADEQVARRGQTGWKSGSKLLCFLRYKLLEIRRENLGRGSTPLGRMRRPAAGRFLLRFIGGIRQ
jgi:hypothetical protein